MSAHKYLDDLFSMIEKPSTDQIGIYFNLRNSIDAIVHNNDTLSGTIGDMSSLIYDAKDWLTEMEEFVGKQAHGVLTSILNDMSALMNPKDSQVVETFFTETEFMKDPSHAIRKAKEVPRVLIVDESGITRMVIVRQNTELE